MVIDTSVLVAILTGEPERDLFALAIRNDPTRLLSAAGYLETSMVMNGRLDGGRSQLDAYLTGEGVLVASIDAAQATIAADAFAIYGRGRGHPAKLNFGDCFSYALAKTTGEPLLFKGDDFVHTDIARIL